MRQFVPCLQLLYLLRAQFVELRGLRLPSNQRVHGRSAAVLVHDEQGSTLGVAVLILAIVGAVGTLRTPQEEDVIRRLGYLARVTQTGIGRAGLRLGAVEL